MNHHRDAKIVGRDAAKKALGPGSAGRAMRRMCLTAAMLAPALLFTLPAQGQGVVQAAGPGTAPASQPAPAPKMYTITVAPAPQPEPALRYFLLPDVPDRTPGNAALLYHTAMELMLSQDKSDVMEKVSDWLDLPLEKLPIDEAQAGVDKYGTALSQAILAARRDKCDWDLPVSEGFSMLIPGLAPCRSMGRALALRARLAVAGGRTDEAIQDLQTGYAMARHIAEGPTLINALVGIAIADQMRLPTLDLMQSKGNVNLYWALASLPRPLIDLRKSLDLERNWLLLGRNAPVLRKAAYGQALSPDEVAALQGEMGKLLSFTAGAGGPGGGEGRVAFTFASIKLYPAAKKHLAKLGYTPEQIEKMPVTQAVAMFSLGRYFHWRDELFKWNAPPWPQAAAGLAKANKALAEAEGKPEEGWPFTTLLPGLSRAGFVAARLDRHLGAMQTIEAVRLYAAAHDGKAPARLDELTDSPAPMDPVTGKDYQYERTEDGFVITCATPAISGYSPADGAVYKVTLRK